MAQSNFGILIQFNFHIKSRTVIQVHNTINASSCICNQTYFEISYTLVYNNSTECILNLTFVLIDSRKKNVVLRKYCY